MAIRFNAQNLTFVRVGYVCWKSDIGKEAEENDKKPPRNKNSKLEFRRDSRNNKKNLPRTVAVFEREFEKSTSKFKRKLISDPSKED